MKVWKTSRRKTKGKGSVVGDGAEEKKES